MKLWVKHTIEGDEIYNHRQLWQVINPIPECTYIPRNGKIPVSNLSDYVYRTKKGIQKGMYNRVQDGRAKLIIEEEDLLVYYCGETINGKLFFMFKLTDLTPDVDFQKLHEACK